MSAQPDKSARVQEAILKALLQEGRLTTEQLSFKVGRVTRTISNLTCRLVSRGFVTRVKTGVFELTLEGRNFLLKGGEIKSGPKGCGTVQHIKRQGSMRTRLWRSMRILGVFTIDDLIELAHEAEKNPYENTQKYVRALSRAGYLYKYPVNLPGVSITSNGHKRFRLIKNTGPEAPTIKDGGTLFDPNTKERIALKKAA